MQSFEGRIVESCDSPAPVAHTVVEMYLVKKSEGVGAGARNFSYSTTTDADGRFSFNFKEKSWDAADFGTYGAEIIVNGRLIFHGITPSHDDLGEIPLDYRREVTVLATIGTENLSSDDTLYINGDFFGAGSFDGINDTISADLVNQVSDDRYVPVIDELRMAQIRWRIKRAAGEYVHGQETFPVGDDCIAQTSHSFTIRP